MPSDPGPSSRFIEMGGSRLPVPDPTEMTTKAMLREIGALRELFDTRLDAMDKAILLLQNFADRQPTIGEVSKRIDGMKAEIDERFFGFRALSEERLNGVKTQIAERDSQSEKTANNVKEAVAAAFSAAKESAAERERSNAAAIDKSEKAMTKQIDGIVDMIKTLTETNEGKINDLKERMTTTESRGAVIDPATQSQLVALTAAVNGLITSGAAGAGHSKGIGDTWGIFIGIVGVLIAIATLIAYSIRNSLV